MKTTPLGMPAGSVRAIITLLCVTFACIYAGLIMYLKVIKGVEAEFPAFILPLLGTTIGYYFGVRTADTTTTTANSTVQPAVKYVPPTPEEPPEVLAG